MQLVIETTLLVLCSTLALASYEERMLRQFVIFCNTESEVHELRKSWQILLRRAIRPGLSFVPFSERKKISGIKKIVNELRFPVIKTCTSYLGSLLMEIYFALDPICPLRNGNKLDLMPCDYRLEPTDPVSGNVYAENFYWQTVATCRSKGYGRLVVNHQYGSSWLNSAYCAGKFLSVSDETIWYVGGSSKTGELNQEFGLKRKQIVKQ